MNCPKCNFDNIENAKFCNNCGISFKSKNQSFKFAINLSNFEMFIKNNKKIVLISFISLLAVLLFMLFFTNVKWQEIRKTDDFRTLLDKDSVSVEKELVSFWVKITCTKEKQKNENICKQKYQECTEKEKKYRSSKDYKKNEFDLFEGTEYVAKSNCENTCYDCEKAEYVYIITNLSNKSIFEYDMNYLNNNNIDKKEILKTLNPFPPDSKWHQKIYNEALNYKIQKQTINLTIYLISLGILIFLFFIFRGKKLKL